MVNSKNSDKPVDTFIPDTPLQDPKDDLFRRWPFSKRIARAIASRTDSSSIVVGIYGAWGEGKTTVLNFIETELNRTNGIISVRFNPWRCSDESQLLLSFFTTLADSLGRSLSTHGEKIGECLHKYASIVAPLTISFAGLGVSPGKLVSEAGKQLSSIDLDQLRDRIEGLLEEEGKRVTVLMDDIDRLDRQEVQAVFRLVKLTADFTNITYVLAFDPDMVADSLGERYGKGSSESGRGFLEKIIQVPLHLPSVDQVSLRQLCFQGVDRAIADAGISLSENDVQNFVSHFVDSLEIKLSTPRMCKRYANALSFALPILKGEVNSVDLMLVEGIRVFYPAAYSMLRENPEVFQGTLRYGESRDSEKIGLERILEGGLRDLSEQEGDALKDLLKSLFPKLSGLLGGSTYGPDWEENWYKEKKIASRNYFARYFSYAVPEGDIPDKDIENLLSIIETSEPHEVADTLRGLVTPRNADKLVMKLRQQEKSLSETVSLSLAKAVAACGDIFPNPKQLFSLLGALSQAGILIHKLLDNIPKGTRRTQAAQELLKSCPILFSFECLRWMRSSDDEPEEKRSFSKEDEDLLGTVVAGRIRDAAKTADPWKDYGDQTPSLLWVWANWLGKDKVSSYLLSKFEADPQNVVEFLKTFVPTAWGMESGISHKSDLRREQYDSITSLIEPGIIYEFLRRTYGGELNNAKSIHSYRDSTLDKKVAFQFAALFHHVKGEAEKKEEGVSQQDASPDG